MKIKLLTLTLFSFSVTCVTWADQHQNLTAEGYRWVTVNGPYACPTEPEVRRVTRDRTDATELGMVEDGTAYYLIPGSLVQIVKDDPL
jgi:hypothetical protein